MKKNITNNYETNVFINCPFDTDFFHQLKTILYTVVYFGFEPRIALESSDSGKARLDKIIGLQKSSKYSIHDLSRLRAKTLDDYFRLNMAFELGLDFGLRESSTNLSSKRTLVLESDKYEYMKAISDLNGYDIKSHQDDPEKLILCIKSWFSETVGLRDLNATAKIYADYILFNRNLFDKKVLKYQSTHSATQAEDFAASEIKEITMPEFIDEVKYWMRRN